MVLKELIFNSSNFGQGVVILKELTCKEFQFCMGVVVLERTDF